MQVSTDGINWTTVGMPSSAPIWQQEVIDLSGYVGQQIQVQFVWQGVCRATGRQPDRWQVDEVSVVAVAPATYAHADADLTEAPTAAHRIAAPTESAPSRPRRSRATRSTASRPMSRSV